MFGRVLIANRGEIARRIVRTCRRLGVSTVAVHSDLDASEPHVHEADAAACLGPAPPAQSYLDIDRVVHAARRHGCDAVHPGYGFLAENAAFAEAVQAAGLVFVGPSPGVLRLLGDKAAAKRHLADAGVPVVPGEHDADLDDAELIAAGGRLGAPLLVKAVAGGGGKGMRTVMDLSHLPVAIAAARREAAAAFGDDRLILERLVTQPRHVEVQVVGDNTGAVINLGERECSVQRRHQKLVEETPSPAVDAALRDRMTRAAVTAARSVGYEGAGTVEFLVAGDTLDDDEPRFAFLEVNTRLQVEHPVTELVTGLDLVELQLRVAAGEPLGVTQDEVRFAGHAIEVRLCAEDPVTHLPMTGPVLRSRIPDDTPGLRVDSGIETGSTVSPHYDPLLAKLIALGPDRERARTRLRGLLDGTVVHGVGTNLELLAAVLDEPAFVEGRLTTSFLGDHLRDFTPSPASEVAWLAAAMTVRHARTPSRAASPWERLGPRRPAGGGGWLLHLDDGRDERMLRIVDRGGEHHIRRDDSEVVVRCDPPTPDGTLHLDVDGIGHRALVTVEPGADGPAAVWVHLDERTRRFAVVPAARPADLSQLAGGTDFGSPMPGSVLAVQVADGDRVAAGATLVVVEAMKMEHPVVTPTAGVVTGVHVAVGDPVEAGTPLVAFQPDAASGSDALAGSDAPEPAPAAGSEPAGADDASTVEATDA